MKHGLLSGLLIGFLVLVALDTQADHIIGGDMTLTYSGTPGQYALGLNMFVDLSGRASNRPVGGDFDPRCYIYRKRDNQLVLTTTLPFKNVQVLFNPNNPCASQVKLQLAVWEYSGTINMPATQFNDPQGYYAIYQRCCRNGNLSNILNPGATGTTFRLDFSLPAVPNSTPVFQLPEARYVCTNDPFVLPLKATDADGDALRYELTDPIAGYLTANNPVDWNGFSQTTYPVVRWASGYSFINPIRGLQPLKVDANNGTLSVTAQQVGLFVFSVMVTETRGGTTLSQTRREYQLPVVDCKKNTTTPPPITYNGKSTTVVERCDDAPVTIATPAVPGFDYQWQLNGTDITGATSTTLAIKEEGAYTVKKSFPYNCGIGATSTKVDVLPPVPPLADILADRTSLTFDGDEILLTAAPQPTSYRLRWSLNGATAGSTSSTLTAGQEGTYRLRVSTSDDRCPSEDTIRIGKFFRLFMPNAFSPNGDSVNDTWEIKNLSSLPGAEVFIFNRNGGLIYYADRNGQPWDGTYENQKVPSGVYRYLVRAPDREPMQGTVHVIY
jgi:gliding motility-associated-like protein